MVQAQDVQLRIMKNTIAYNYVLHAHQLQGI